MTGYPNRFHTDKVSTSVTTPTPIDKKNLERGEPGRIKMPKQAAHAIEPKMAQRYNASSKGSMMIDDHAKFNSLAGRE